MGHWLKCFVMLSGLFTPALAWGQIPVTCTLVGTTVTCPSLTLQIPGYTFQVPASTTTTVVQTPPTTPIVSGTASALDTSLAFTGGGLQIKTFQLPAPDSANQGMALWPTGVPITTTVGGSTLPFNMLGDAQLGDIYCVDDEASGAAIGCGYGASLTGKPRGGRFYQSNRFINTNDGTGGPGLVLWPDRPGIDGSGNRGYMDIWGWGQPDTPFSGSLNFGVRGNDGQGHRLFRLTNSLEIIFPELGGAGVARLCIGAAGVVQRGGC